MSSMKSKPNCFIWDHYVMQWGVVVSDVTEKKCYGGVHYKFSITRGWVGVKFRGKKALHNNTLEWLPKLVKQ